MVIKKDQYLASNDVMNLKEFQLVKEISLGDDKLCDGLYSSVAQKWLKQVNGKRMELMVICLQMQEAA